MGLNHPFLTRGAVILIGHIMFIENKSLLFMSRMIIRCRFPYIYLFEENVYENMYFRTLMGLNHQYAPSKHIELQSGSHGPINIGFCDLCRRTRADVEFVNIIWLLEVCEVFHTKLQLGLNHPFATRRAMILILHFMFHPKLITVVHVACDKQMSIFIGIFVKYICRKVCPSGDCLTKFTSFPLQAQWTGYNLLRPIKRSFLWSVS